jgi:A/G-specific adenine glycosylase
MKSPTLAQTIAQRLIVWHADQQRDLPWRAAPAGQRDAYEVWVSEIMAQQTRIATVVDYFTRWMARFPSLESLAGADQQEVLKLWEGLGYYSRARNLHRASQVVVEQYGGEIPSSRVELLKLPGIGAYTAGAILSLAFGQAEPILDGNVKRVLARLWDMDRSIDETATTNELWRLAGEIVCAAPTGKAGEVNEGLMELGGLVCTPQNPRCLLCPLAALCRSALNETQSERPVRTPRKRTPHYQVAAAVIWEDAPFQGRLLIAQRPEGNAGRAVGVSRRQAGAGGRRFARHSAPGNPGRDGGGDCGGRADYDCPARLHPFQHHPSRLPRPDCQRHAPGYRLRRLALDDAG